MLGGGGERKKARVEEAGAEALRVIIAEQAAALVQQAAVVAQQATALAQKDAVIAQKDAVIDNLTPRAAPVVNHSPSLHNLKSQLSSPSLHNLNSQLSTL